MDMIGKKFGKWIVIEKTNERAKNNGEFIYKCICECGKIKKIRKSHLKYGNSKSCGCTRNNNINFMKKCRSKNIRIYNIYQNMKQRCYYKKSKGYKYYGEKGIKICNEWLKDYESFYNWAINNGYKDDLSIDRIDVNGNYEPNNCRWSNKIQQANNMTTNRHITYKGETKTLAEWSRILNMSQQKLRYRINNWTIEEAFKK